jgi:hypothetical protein
VAHVIVHTPSEQVGVAFVPPHTAPHAPQWLRLVCVFVSHPLAALPSQFAHPALHTGVHTPATHEVVPCAFVHALPQAPQSVAVVSRFVPHPLFRLPSQSPQPAVHTGAQTPATQEVVP